MSNLVFDESSANSEASHGYAWWFSGDTFKKAAAEERTRRKRSFIHHLTSHPGRLTIIYFLLLVALSTSLLLLPVSSHEEEPTSFSTAFFTAVSALSTCGISIVNATTHWTAFGQVVLLVSVQMGGLGVMTFASLIALAANHHMKATQRLLTANELGTTKLNEIRGVLTVVITTTFIIESVTFLALFPGLYGINRGNVRHTAREALFFAVMSYNNAGFTPDGAGPARNNWAVGMPIMGQRVLRHAGISRAAQPHALRPPPHSPTPLEPAHQDHLGDDVLAGAAVAGVVPAGGMGQPVPVQGRRRGDAAALRGRRGGNAAQLRLRPELGAAGERADEGVHERHHVHRRRQHLHGRRHPRHDVRGHPTDLPCRVHRTHRHQRLPAPDSDARGDDRGEHHRRLPVPSAERVTGVDARLGLLAHRCPVDAVRRSGCAGYRCGVAREDNPAALFILATAWWWVVSVR